MKAERKWLNMWKRLPSLVMLVFIITLSLQTTVASANPTVVTTPCTPNANKTFLVGQQIGNGSLIDCVVQQQIDDAVDDAGLMDGFIMGQANNLFKIPGVNSLQNLVFGNPYPTWGFNGDDTNQLQYGIFYDSEISSVIKPIMTILGGIYVSILTLAILLSSLKVGLKAHSPQAKTDFWTDIYMWVFSAFFIAGFWYLFSALMDANQALVQELAKTLIGKNINLQGFSIIAGAGGFQASDVLVFLAEWGLALYLNIIYISRKLIIILLVAMSPFAAYSLLFAKTRSFFGTWIKELIGNIFLQSMHAIILFMFCMIASIMNGGPGAMVFKLGMIIMFIPITGMLSKWLNLGDSSTKIGSAATMMGAGAIGGAMMLMKGTPAMVRNGNAQGGFGSLGGGMGASGGGAGGAGGAGESGGMDSGATAISRAAAGGSKWNSAKSTMGKVGGFMGATMGLSMGPAGVMLGSRVGSGIMSGGMQAARNIGSGMINTGKSIAGEKGLSGLTPSAMKERWSNLEERRNTFGNVGESLGSVVGKGEAGRSMGQMLSGVSRPALHSANPSVGGFGEQTLEDIASNPINAGRDVRWDQTNEGSRFSMDDGSGNYKPISVMGAADSELKNGEVRSVSFKLPEAGESFKRSPNGQYTVASIGGGSSGDPRGGREVVGAAGGSTQFLARTSGAQIRGADGKKFEDSRFDASKINPDAYFNHNVAGADRRTDSDKGADFLSRSGNQAKNVIDHGKNAAAWAGTSVKNKLGRYKGAV